MTRSSQLHVSRRSLDRFLPKPEDYVHCRYIAPCTGTVVSVYLHRIVSVERLTLRLNRHSSTATREQLSPDLRANAVVTVGEQQIQESLI